MLSIKIIPLQVALAGSLKQAITASKSDERDDFVVFKSVARDVQVATAHFSDSTKGKVDELL